MTEFSQVIGCSVPRVDAMDKLTGVAKYAGDLTFDHVLHLKVLRSDRPHAKILGMDTTTAIRHPGVAAVFTSKDIPGKNQLRRGQQVFCEERVRCVGDPLAMVAAETPAAAQEALELIQIRYEDLPGVFSPEESLLENAVKVHDSGNVFMERTLRKGNPEDALREAEVKITNIYRTQMVEHAYLEPEAGIARYSEKKITVWMPCKYAHADCKEIAAVLGFPVDRIRIINTTIGGSFGDKTSLSPGYYAALASLITGRPAKMEYSRQESFIASTKRHPYTIRYTTGAAKDGSILVAKIDITADIGAYAASSLSVLVKSLIHASGPYEIPNILIDIRGVYTNNPISASMRGLGVPQVAMAHESQLDILAKTLGLDPFAVRLKNALKPGSITATGQRLGKSVGLEDTIKNVRSEIVRLGTPANSSSRRYGWGIASMFYGIGNAGRPGPGSARIEANNRGEFTLFVGCGDVGQGSSTILTQIVASVLDCSTDNIRIVSNDTDICPDSGPTVASRVTYVVGGAVQRAARRLKLMLQEAAAELMGANPGDLQLSQGVFCLPDSTASNVSIGQAVMILEEREELPRAEESFAPEVSPLDGATSQGAPMATYAFATQGALVSVDVDSGEVALLSLIASHDVGRAINPCAVAGQIEGAVAMGLGYGLMEEVALKDGVIMNPTLSEYYIPTSLDIPETTIILVEAAETTGPYGAKGVGEPALICTAPAILNAISAATGVHPKKLPLTSESLCTLLNNVESNS